ncbi:MAG: hypothetical protein ACYCSP_01595, partial [Acidobacteriaceae bacterium]
AARQFLNRFHSEEKLEQARDGRKPEQIAFIPEEADALAGLGEVNRELVRELGRRCPDQRTATVDQGQSCSKPTQVADAYPTTDPRAPGAPGTVRLAGCDEIDSEDRKR